MITVDLMSTVQEIDLDGQVDEARQVKYIGKASKRSDGTWACLANVSGALCVVEVEIKAVPREEVA